MDGLPDLKDPVNIKVSKIRDDSGTQSSTLKTEKHFISVVYLCPPSPPPYRFIISSINASIQRTGTGKRRSRNLGFHKIVKITWYFRPNLNRCGFCTWGSKSFVCPMYHVRSVTLPKVQFTFRFGNGNSLHVGSPPPFIQELSVYSLWPSSYLFLREFNLSSHCNLFV